MDYRIATGAALLAAFVSAGVIQAQTTMLDEGVFVHTVQGSRIATESFTIRRNGTGPNASTIAQGRVLAEDRSDNVRASVQAEGTRFQPSAYEIVLEGVEPQRLMGRVVGNRISAHITSPTGEMMREYIVSDGALVIDPEVAHHYFFLARRLGSEPARIPIVMPRQSRQVSVTVTPHGTETISVAGRDVVASRVTVAFPGSPGTAWFDDQGRVLRIELAGRNFSAVRTSLPDG